MFISRLHVYSLHSHPYLSLFIPIYPLLLGPSVAWQHLRRAHSASRAHHLRRRLLCTQSREGSAGARHAYYRSAVQNTAGGDKVSPR